MALFKLRSVGGGNEGFARLSSSFGSAATTALRFNVSVEILLVRVPSDAISVFSTTPLAAAWSNETLPAFKSTEAFNTGVLSSTFCCTISPEGSAMATFNVAPSTDNVLEEPDELATRFSEASVSVTLGSVELIDPPVSTTGELETGDV